MLGPEDFTVIVVALIALSVVGVLIVGFMHRARGGTPPPEKVRRDVIAEGAVTPAEVAEMLEAENARLRAQGMPELRRHEVESRIVGDRRFRERLLRLRLRRHPDRARRLA